jgi:hypothetical protein
MVAGSGQVLPPPETRLAAVSCPLVSFCMAVGGAEGADFSPFSQERDSEGKWRTLAAPARQPDSELVAVSCPRPRRCLAVGRGDHTGIPFADAWDGQSWRLLPALTVPTHAVLTGVSCPHAAPCIAVGSGRTAFAAHGALAELWNGTSWTRLGTIGPAGATSSGFAAISCADGTHCLAVGQYQDSPSLAGHALAESWNGSAWTLLTGPAGAISLTSVYCLPVIFGICVVVGEATGGGLFAAEWAGGTWTTLSVPSPGSAVPGLMSVSCGNASGNFECVAVGDDDVTGTGPYAENWFGGPSWILNKIPDPARVPRELAAISCINGDACLAVGQEDTFLRPDVVPFAEVLPGRAASFRTQQVDSLGAVSCLGPASCLAVGGYLDSDANPQLLSEKWTGRGLRLAGPSGAARAAGGFADVSCAGSSYCMAVGQTFGQSAFVADRWNGRHWIAGTSADVISQVSCSRGAFCLGFGGPTGTELWNGVTWRRGPAMPRPRGSTTSGAADVSCTGPDYCMAVGSYTTDPHGEVNVPLVETWDGAAWKIKPVPVPGPDAALDAVACVRGQGCMAVGNYQDAHGTGHNLAMLWNGHRWRVFALPGGFGYGSGPINGLSGATAISCPRLSACMAVGGFLDPRTGQHSIALAWAGGSWRLTRLAGRGPALADVFCPSRDSCLAVGQAGRLTLAEHWNGSAWILVRSLNP